MTSAKIIEDSLIPSNRELTLELRLWSCIILGFLWHSLILTGFSQETRHQAEQYQSKK